MHMVCWIAGKGYGDARTHLSTSSYTNSRIGMHLKLVLCNSKTLASNHSFLFLVMTTWDLVDQVLFCVVAARDLSSWSLLLSVSVDCSWFWKNENWEYLHNTCMSGVSRYWNVIVHRIWPWAIEKSGTRTKSIISAFNIAVIYIVGARINCAIIHLNLDTEWTLRDRTSEVPMCFFGCFIYYVILTCLPA